MSVLSTRPFITKANSIDFEVPTGRKYDHDQLEEEQERNQQGQN
jgi:hypothetical protein